MTAPQAVVMPQPRRQTFSSGAFLSTATTETSATTVYCEKVEVPIYLLCSASVLETIILIAYKVMDRLSVDSESTCIVGHESFSLGSANYMQFINAKKTTVFTRRLTFPTEIGLSALAEFTLATFYK